MGRGIGHGARIMPRQRRISLHRIANVTRPAGAIERGAPSRTRIEALDTLRGVAVGGILLANVLVFFGLFLLPPEQAAALPGAAFDGAALFAQRVLVEGKFYSIFSLLFGAGFGLQLIRGDDAALPRFKRRLRILLAIGAVHAFLIWAGDILMLYALLGLTLPYFARKTDAQLLRWALGLLAAPTVLYALGMVAWWLSAPAPDPAAAPPAAGIPPQALRLISAMGTGGVADALIGNLVFLAGRWADLVVTMRFPKVLGMFVLGLWAVRQGIVQRPSEHRARLVRWSRLGWLVGLPANVLAAWAFARWEYLPPSPAGLIGVAGQALGVPMLAIGYACSVALLAMAGSRSPFAPVGRMALTNYLMHSVVCVVLAYGFGFGLWWRISATTAFAIALAIVAVQIPLSSWWLARFQFGPAEWLWRRLTYRQPLRMRRE
jgi:uncharacterized protein